MSSILQNKLDIYPLVLYLTYAWYTTSMKFWGSSRYPICMQYISHIPSSSKFMPYIWGNVITPKPIRRDRRAANPPGQLCGQYSSAGTAVRPIRRDRGAVDLADVWWPGNASSYEPICIKGLEPSDGNSAWFQKLVLSTIHFSVSDAFLASIFAIFVPSKLKCRTASMEQYISFIETGKKWRPMKFITEKELVQPKKVRN